MSTVQNKKYQVNDLTYWVDSENSNEFETSARYLEILTNGELTSTEKIAFIQIIIKANQQENIVTLADIEPGNRKEDRKNLPFALKRLESLGFISELIGGK